jgi:hypothetical protein
MTRQWFEATAVVTSWLTAVQDLPVRWAVPDPRPNAFIVVRRSGSGEPSSWQDVAQMDIECWSGGPHSNPKPASDLAAAVRGLLDAMPDGDNPVREVTVTGVALSPDPVSRCPRVVIGCQVQLRAAA